jgi:type II restriction/modification system DNA methylase subunit YeeA
MTPEAFISKWQAAELKERAAAQSHFNDLCSMLGEPSPTDADPKGEWYAFERGATKTTGGEGWADVWKRGCFGWEYKGKRKDLNAAFAQLQQYALALENPPLLVVCDLNRFRIHTNWTNTVSEVHEFTLEDIRDPLVRQKLKWTLSDPEKLRPKRTRQSLTEGAAAEFAALALRLRGRGHDPERVAHFINRLIFCMFAEDVDLLPKNVFSRMLKSAESNPEQFKPRAEELFRAMKTGGEAAWEPIDWFNGGLFDDDSALPLDKDDLKLAIRAADLDWAEIDPSILGTLFERGLDPGKRSQLGAHYTDREKIMLIIEPVVIRPWLAEWEKAKEMIRAALEKEQKAKSASAKTKAHGEALALYRAFLDRLRAFRVLDPACGSGNFLYLALLALKDLEHRVSIEGEALGFHREFPAIGPASVKGIEINLYAAELARVSVWIGEIQWMRRNGFGVSRNPILKALKTIECRDALVNPDGTEAIWPAADAIVGNPPFLGAKKMSGELGTPYVERLRKNFERLPGFVDFVSYWFEKSSELIAAGKVSRAGLVATNSIAMGTNLSVMKRVAERTDIFEAWSDEGWTVAGADVRVALICMGAKSNAYAHSLNGTTTNQIGANLSDKLVSTIDARKLPQNRSVAYVGIQKTGPFDIPGDMARSWLTLPSNPNGLTNASVLRPYWNGIDLTRRPRDYWLIDFPLGKREAEVSLFEVPFKYALQHAKPTRVGKREARANERWWEHYWPRTELRRKTGHMRRFIVTPEVAKHRLFAWMTPPFLPDKNLTVVVRDDDTTFGILQSRFHEAWALRLGTWLGVGNDPRYTPTTTFETFPFPAGLTPNIPAIDYAADPRAVRIAEAARRLNALRESWLNPADLVKCVPEVVPGFPDRILPVDDKAAAILKKRTLTNLYNERPTWLVNAHRDLDEAVAAAYGWPKDISDEDALERLLALNLERSASTVPATLC